MLDYLISKYIKETNFFPICSKKIILKALFWVHTRLWFTLWHLHSMGLPDKPDPTA